MAMLHDLKLFIRDELGIPSWLVLVAAGCLVHILLNAALRKPVTSCWGLIAPVVLGVALETYEIWVQYRPVGLFAPGNDPLLTILGRHGVDILILLAGPVVMVVVGAVFAKTH